MVLPLPNQHLHLRPINIFWIARSVFMSFMLPTLMCHFEQACTLSATISRIHYLLILVQTTPQTILCHSLQSLLSDNLRLATHRAYTRSEPESTSMTTPSSLQVVWYVYCAISDLTTPLNEYSEVFSLLHDLTIDTCHRPPARHTVSGDRRAI
jgi:hypothetical protein